jgi:N-hydroxyarylamine O-acetyltransferase
MEGGEVFRIEETPAGDLDVLRNGAPVYRLEQRPRLLADFEVGAWFNRTSPASPFTAPWCARDGPPKAVSC